MRPNPKHVIWALLVVAVVLPTTAVVTGQAYAAPVLACGPLSLLFLYWGGGVYGLVWLIYACWLASIWLALR